MPRPELHQWLAWPPPAQVFAPKGAGASVYAEFVQQKIGDALNRAHPGLAVKVGVLTLDPASGSTSNPFAVVCEFPRAAPPGALARVQQLAWCFSRTAIVVTIEPHQLRAESCWLDPTQPESERLLCSMPLSGKFKPDGSPEQRRVRDLLHRVNLITARWHQLYPAKFPADGRAEVHLLKTMRRVRTALLTSTATRPGLPQRHCHDLLARLIFTQFLFDRKDSKGVPFFSDSLLKRLHEKEGVFSIPRTSLAAILASKKDTYRLFRWMDEIFNGDLFPGKQTDEPARREAAWKTESDAVAPEHLRLLADLVSGDLELDGHQRSLWRHYSFDTIPLEFISSIYEEFLTAEERQQDKAYYTPSHLVDYVLDAVLPWHSKEWDNVRILDPCCGSGIFLVKSFQRLIHRWRLAHPKKKPLVRDLRPILENQLTGVDRNEEAVRVASFSLYLAMADAIEPRHYMTRGDDKVFPHLTGTRLLCADFFDEETPGIRTAAAEDRYDLVLGNAPWGDKSIAPRLKDESEAEYKARLKKTKPKAVTWAKEQKWKVANNDIGPVFLGKAAALVKPTGGVAMVNTASLLTWRDGPATELRRKLFTNYTFDEITNLSALRRVLFPEVIGPACVVIFRPGTPDPEQELFYYTPKPTRELLEAGSVAAGTFTVEPQDIARLTHADAAEVAVAWTVLALGGQRHLALIRQLGRLPTLAKLEAAGEVTTRKGVIDGDKQQHFPLLKNKPILKAPRFPDGVFLELDAADLPVWETPVADGAASNDFSAFEGAHLFIKQSYVARQEGRMRAAIVKRSPKYKETICREAYVSVRDLTPDRKHLETACLAYNSTFAVFYLGLTSSSFPLYISKVTVNELLDLPLPASGVSLARITDFAGVDKAMRDAYGLNLNEADWHLVDDFLAYTLPDALTQRASAGRSPTKRRLEIKHEEPKRVEVKIEPELTAYAETFLRVMQATFGKSRGIAATIYTEPAGPQNHQPLRMVTIHLGSTRTPAVRTEQIEADGLLEELGRRHAQDQAHRASGGNGSCFQRVTSLFDHTVENGVTVVNLSLIRPDECRYWTRTAALRDAGRLGLEIIQAAARPASK